MPDGGLGDMGIHNLAPVFSALKLGAPETIQATSTPVFPETVPLAAMGRDVVDFNNDDTTPTNTGHVIVALNVAMDLLILLLVKR